MEAYYKIVNTYKTEGLKGLFIKFIRLRIKVYRSGAILILRRYLNEIPPKKLKLNVSFKALGKQNIDEINTLGFLKTQTVNEYLLNGSKCLGAYFEDNLVAYTWVHYNDYYFPFFDYNFTYKGVPYLGPDFVSPDYRGYGIQVALSTEVYKQLLDEGFEYVYSSVWPTNTKSIGNLKLVGYKPIKLVKAIRLLNRLVYKKTKNVDSWDY